MNEAAASNATIQTDTPPSRRDLSVDIKQASLYGPLMLAPLILAFFLAFVVMWSFKTMIQGAISFLNLFSFLTALVLGTLVHELLHAVGWWRLGRVPWRAIKFGFMLSALAPYAHCQKPLEIGAYRGGAALPGLILGVLPMILALWSGNGWLLSFGALFTLAAGGDALILWLIRGVKRGALVEDHLTRAGCIILEPAVLLPRNP